ncbi:MAG TPA: bifunctional diguanylate cyclase/phosphodiesterase, partial [Nocardioides sp.]|uniref:putative bifunctional diguanylate cyclase/phosphodiesterase n=1 Tax=Nocardioides sp. TaxID=35761 RepID=UPI002E2FF151
VRGLVLTIRDDEVRQDLRRRASRDPLTGLANRSLLAERIAACTGEVALLYIDLNGFKPINDRLGHAAGDEVLVEVARRLVESTRDSDTVARLGGDEFAVLLEDVTMPEVIEISNRILEALTASVEVAGTSAQLGASIGIAYGDGSESGEALLRQADLAMYEAKGRGKAQYVAYEPSIGHARLQRLELVEALRRAIDLRELDVVYQPVVATESCRIAGVEALARWQLDGTEVPPEVFVRIAEDTGLVVQMGELILDQVAHDAPSLREAAGGPISMSVNVSARQLREPGFVQVVERTVRAMGRTALVLEITERQGVANDEQVLAAMQTIAAMGVRFAIDDFGVGFSSISYLQDLPAHVVKTDAALAQNIDRDERARAVLRAVTVMANSLGLDVVIEGVERQGQLDAVRDSVDAPFVQGYLLHRPMGHETLLVAVRTNRRRAATGPDHDEVLVPTA